MNTVRVFVCIIFVSRCLEAILSIVIKLFFTFTFAPRHDTAEVDKTETALAVARYWRRAHRLQYAAAEQQSLAQAAVGTRLIPPIRCNLMRAVGPCLQPLRPFRVASSRPGFARPLQQLTTAEFVAAAKEEWIAVASFGRAAF